MLEASDQQIATHPGPSLTDSTAVARDQSRAVFGQVMGFVALTLGCLALGAYIGRDLSGGWGILFFLQLFGGDNE
jgi:hypothetical protein